MNGGNVTLQIDFLVKKTFKTYTHRQQHQGRRLWEKAIKHEGVLVLRTIEKRGGMQIFQDLLRWNASIMRLNICTCLRSWGQFSAFVLHVSYHTMHTYILYVFEYFISWLLWTWSIVLNVLLLNVIILAMAGLDISKSSISKYILCYLYPQAFFDPPPGATVWNDVHQSSRSRRLF